MSGHLVEQLDLPLGDPRETLSQAHQALLARLGAYPPHVGLHGKQALAHALAARSRVEGWPTRIEACTDEQARAWTAYLREWERAFVEVNGRAE